MAKFNYAYSNFSIGQIGKKSIGRFDLKEYNNALEALENMVVIPQGGVVKRPGTRYITEASGFVQLVPYTTATGVSYIIAINTTGSTTSDCIEIFDVNGNQKTVGFFNGSDPSYPNVTPFYRATALDATGDWKQSSNIDINGFNFLQIGDVLIITHISGEVRPIAIVITPNGSNDFETDDLLLPVKTDPTTNQKYLSDINNALRYPFLDENISSDIKLKPSAVTGSITITAEDSVAAAVNFFDNNIAGTLVRLIHGGTEGIAIITKYNSASSVAATVLIDFGGTTATTAWSESAFGRSGYPKTITYFEDRILYGGTIKKPETIYGSMTANIYHMMEKRLVQDASSDASGLNFFIHSNVQSSDKLTDSKYPDRGRIYLVTDPFVFTIAGNLASHIKWMTTKDSVLIGTENDEYIMDGVDQALSRASVRIKRQTSFGGYPTRPISVDQNIVFITEDGKRLRTFAFSRDNGSYVSANLNLLADDIHLHNKVSGGVSTVNFTSMVNQPATNVIWVITDTYQLLGLTYDSSTGTVAWHTHTIGGDGEVVGLTSIPGTNNIYVCVKRLINSSFKFYIEKITNIFNQNTLSEITGTLDDLPWFVDSGKYVSNSPASATVSGLSHLEGEEVRVFADGVDVGKYTVSSGEITLDSAAEHIIVGYEYTNKIGTLPLDVGNPIGSALGNIQNISRAALRLYKTRDFNIGEDGNVEAVSLTRMQQDIPTADREDFYTGDYPIRIDTKPGLGVKVVISQTNAYPMTILSLAMEGMTND